MMSNQDIDRLYRNITNRCEDLTICPPCICGIDYYAMGKKVSEREYYIFQLYFLITQVQIELRIISKCY